MTSQAGKGALGLKITNKSLNSVVGLNFPPVFPYLYMNGTLPISLLYLKRMLPTVKNYYYHFLVKQ